jgi:hypothetical protein
MSEFKFADSVSLRLVQIFQEAILTGVDGGDLLRQVRVQVDPNDSNTLILTDEYVKQVKEMHDKLEKQAIELQATKSGGGILIN